MTAPLSDRQLTGLDESHLLTLGSGHRLLPEVDEAFARLKCDAAKAGFELAIASSYRSFSRQRTIWNGKACGERPVYNDAGESIDLATLQPPQQLRALLRFSAIPGTSRHHWGTDLDVYDAAAIPEGYQLQLSPQEVAPGGMFDALHCWLDEQMASGCSHGFYRPYAGDRGGVSVERWHLSYAPLSQACASSVSCDLLRRIWAEQAAEQDVLLREVFEGQLPEIFERYIAVPEGWCSP